MRISTTQFYQAGTNALNRQQSQLLETYQQMSSGRRMVDPSDDPLGAARAINVAQSKSLNARLAENRNIAKQNLAMEDTALTSAALLMQDLKTRLVEASNGALSDADRQTLSQVIKDLRDSMLGIANMTDGNGQYLFSGHQGDRAPFVQTGAAITWQGDQGKRMIQVDQSRQISSGDDGLNIFMQSAVGDRSYSASASASNTGSGYAIDPVIKQSHGANVGRDFNIAFVGTPATRYTVAVTQKDGTPIGVTLGPTPFDATSGLIVLPGGMQVTVKGAPADGDQFGVHAVNGENISVFDTLAKLSNVLSIPTAGDFGAVARLRAVLIESGQKVEANYNQMLAVRVSIGTRLNEVDALDASGDQQSLGISAERSRIEDLDFHTASMTLQMRQAGLEAASLAFQKIQSLTLFSIRR